MEDDMATFELWRGDPAADCRCIARGRRIHRIGSRGCAFVVVTREPTRSPSGHRPKVDCHPSEATSADGLEWECSICGTALPSTEGTEVQDMTRYGYGDAGHPFDPDRYGRCRKAGAGYCEGTRADPQHDEREPGLTGTEVQDMTRKATPRYVAGYNMPGYLPETDPETFETLDEAVAYLRETLARWLDEDEAPEDMTAEDIIMVDAVAGYAEGWYTPPQGGAEMHLWVDRYAEYPDDHDDCDHGCLLGDPACPKYPARDLCDICGHDADAHDRRGEDDRCETCGGPCEPAAPDDATDSHPDHEGLRAQHLDGWTCRECDRITLEERCGAHNVEDDPTACADCRALRGLTGTEVQDMSEKSEAFAKTEALLKTIHERNVAAGLLRRCPTCDAGAGKWCVGLEAPQTHPARKDD